MGLVICDGVQWDSEKLPAGIDPKKCVPADEWFAKNRKNGKTPAEKATKKTARKADG